MVAMQSSCKFVCLLNEKEAAERPNIWKQAATIKSKHWEKMSIHTAVALKLSLNLKKTL
jgi:hypothetical protein